MSKVKIIPELRFPEFENEGEWENIKLKQFGTFYRGLTYGATDTASKGLLVLRSGNIQKDTLILNNDLVFVAKECPENLKLLNGDIIICMSNGSKALVGKNAEYKGNYEGDITVGAFCSIMRPKNNFTKYLLQSDIYQEFIALSIGGGNINNLKNSDLEEFSCSAPKNRKEKHKIASCISSLDNLIEAHIQKLDVLKEHKKGMMQNLFPQEGEKVPKYRFKEFEKKWEKVKLKDVSTYFNGGSYENDVKEDGKYELITLKSINKYGQLVNSNRYIDIEVATLSIGTLVMILSEQAPGLLGMTAIIPENNKYVLNQRVAEIRPNQKVICFFLSMAINRNQVYFSKQGAGMKVQNITKPNVENYEFLVPEINEQQKIASCLSSLDALITAQAEKIEQLKLHKKGLMQGMFPKIEI